MKTTKRLLAVLLALVLLCVGVPFVAQAAAVQAGDLIQFGTYPQTKVSLTAAMWSAVNNGSWRSYNYTLSDSAGSYPSDYMKFMDFFADGVKYRAIRFESYRPRYNDSSSDNSALAYQNSNGYYVGSTYCFRYEPLTWRVLDPESGLVMCERIIDSQPFQNYVNASGYWYKDFSDSSLANDYSTSYIRSWLNDSFLETAFSNTQKANIQTASFDCEKVLQKKTITLEDQIFLLSYDDALNGDYGFDTTAAEDINRVAAGTDYANCQGLFRDKDHDYNSYWLLRSGDTDTDYYIGRRSCIVSTQGKVDKSVNALGSVRVSFNGNGVRPACKLKQLKNNVAVNYQLLSERMVQTGDLIQFGTYPQSKVTDENVIAALDAVEKDWTAYPYYCGTNQAGSMHTSAFMYFCDFMMDGKKYRAVSFTEYRPKYTSSSFDSEYASYNGYEKNTVHYFIYEPLVWRVLDPATGLVMCERLIDAQAFQNTYIAENGPAVHQPGSNIFTSDFAWSSIRDWLNYDFFETAFSPQQKDNIVLTIVQNESHYNSYVFEDSEDRVFLASASDLANCCYGFPSSNKESETRAATGTDYAVCQGLEYRFNSYANTYYLRTAKGTGYTWAVSKDGCVGDYTTYVYDTRFGVRPACRLTEIQSDVSLSPVLFSTYCQHMNRATFDAVEPTCTQPGHGVYKYCSDCGSVFAGSTESIPTLGHDFEDWQTEAEATCTDPGRQTRQCLRCGTVEDETVELLSHDYSIVCVTEATCTEPGFTRYTCSRCQDSYTADETDPLGHTPQTYTTPSTCAENGFTITICTRCGETLSKEILPRLEHTWTSEVTQNPTCTAQGVKTYTCESCGETYTEPVDVLAHQWDDGKMTKEPSCTEAGEMTYTCATGGETRTEPIDKLDHEIVLVAGKAATCTEPGLTDGWQCKNCKKWFAEQQTIPALGHDPQIGAVVEPTCTDPGYTPFICTRCGETVSKTDPTDALGHNMQPTYVWAKDDSTVTATMVCTRCDKTGMTETAEVKTEVTVKPTCSTEGELTLIAAFNNKSFYGQTKTKTLPRDPNAHVFKVTVTPPTCIDDGYTTHACTLCRYGYSDEIVSALGHKPVTDEAVPATCEAPGLTEGSHCSVCGEVLTAQEETPALDHADADNDGLCDTCEQQMTGGDHCKYCGKVHDGAFGWLISFFHSILAIFKR